MSTPTAPSRCERATIWIGFCNLHAFQGTCTLPAAAGMALHRLVKNGMVTLQPTPPPSFSSAPLDGTCAVVITDAAVLQELPHPSMPPSKV